MVKIEFEFNSEYGIYRDAIVLPENHELTFSEIEAMKEQRFNSWLQVVQPREE